jgi:hypothetical protein
MEKQSISPPVAIAIVIVAVLLIGFIGYSFMNSRGRGPDGQDLSKPAQLPPSMQQGYPNTQRNR